MNWAIKNNEKIQAIPKERATCPLCNQEVIAKCGEINIWHWAHKQDFECDSFGEPESEWHLKWKNYFPKECQEVTIIKGLKKHRADIQTKNGLIIELQNSPISLQEIREREKFYENMIWILNVESLGKNIVLYKKRFKWKWMPKGWEYSFKKIYVDFAGDKLICLDIQDGTFTQHSKWAFIIFNGGKPYG